MNDTEIAWAALVVLFMLGLGGLKFYARVYKAIREWLGGL